MHPQCAVHFTGRSPRFHHCVIRARLPFIGIPQLITAVPLTIMPVHQTIIGIPVSFIGIPSTVTSMRITFIAVRLFFARIPHNFTCVRLLISPVPLTITPVHATSRAQQGRNDSSPTTRYHFQFSIFNFLPSPMPSRSPLGSNHSSAPPVRPPVQVSPISPQ